MDCQVNEKVSRDGVWTPVVDNNHRFETLSCSSHRKSGSEHSEFVQLTRPLRILLQRSTTTAKEMRQYPSLENLEAMEPEGLSSANWKPRSLPTTIQKLHAVFTALRELHCCAGIVKTRGDTPIHLLAVEQLLKKMCHEDIRAYYKLEEETVRSYARDLLETGDASWFVRWATDRYLGFKQSKELPVQEWATFGLRSLKKVIIKLENITMWTKGLLQQDKALKSEDEDHFLELLELLQQSFMLTHNSLKTEGTSNVGIQ